MVTSLHICDAFANRLHHTSSLMAKDTGKEPLRVVTVQGVCVRVAQSCRLNLDPHFTRSRGGDGDCGHVQRLVRLPGDSCFAFDGLTRGVLQSVCTPCLPVHLRQWREQASALTVQRGVSVLSVSVYNVPRRSPPGHCFSQGIRETRCCQMHPSSTDGASEPAGHLRPMWHGTVHKHFIRVQLRIVLSPLPNEARGHRNSFTESAQRTHRCMHSQSAKSSPRIHVPTFFAMGSVLCARCTDDGDATAI
jgi:hypothetical protein